MTNWGDATCYREKVGGEGQRKLHIRGRTKGVRGEGGGREGGGREDSAMTHIAHYNRYVGLGKCVGG